MTSCYNTFGALRRSVCLSLLALTAATCAWGQDTTPIRLVVGFPAGGSTDSVARTLALGMERELGRPVVVENRPGAGGQIAAQLVKAARPDGATLFLTNSHAITMIPHTVKNPGYDVGRDFTAVSLVAINPDVFAVSTVGTAGAAPASLREFAAWAQQSAGRGNVGVPAPVSVPEFAVLVIGQALGAPLKAVPYRGDGPVAQDVVAGQVAAGIGSVGVMVPHLPGGKVRILAVNGTQRVATIPDVPTYSELGIKGLDDQIFTAVIAPAGLPADIVRRYNAAIGKIVATAEMREKLSNLGLTLMGSTPEALGQRIEASSRASAELVKRVGFVPQ
jgi:tripartite-type tricarboxylate transporter receptor subunit TctC